jgi:hypothetical protein
MTHKGITQTHCKAQKLRSVSSRRLVRVHRHLECLRGLLRGVLVRGHFGCFTSHSTACNAQIDLVVAG